MYLKKIYSLLFILNFLSHINIICTDFKIIGYYPNWVSKTNFFIKNIDGSLFTHINYSITKLPITDFDKINLIELGKLKKKYSNLKTLLSICSPNFSKVVNTPLSRTNFINLCLKFCKKYNLNGIDIDWEFPKNQKDKQNFTIFLKEFSESIKKENLSLLLTIAGPAGLQNLQNIEIDKIHKFINWINVMAYDFNQPSENSKNKVTNHLAPLYYNKISSPNLNVDNVVKYYLKKGVPSDKIILGMPLYGRSYANAKFTKTGFLSKYSGFGGGSLKPGVYLYSEIKNLIPKFTEHWDEKAKSSYFYNPNNKEFISIESKKSLQIKAQYIKLKNLGGAMFWALYNKDSMEPIQYVKNEFGKI